MNRNTVKIWSYWEGPKPPYIDICIASMEGMYSTFILVTPETLDQYLPPHTLHINYKLLTQPALRADCVRAALLATHGGFWFDADTVAIKDPCPLIVDYDNPQVICTKWDKDPFRILNGYIYFNKDNFIAQQWLEEINRVLVSDPSSASWCSLGEKLLTSLIRGDGTNAILVPRNTFLPIDIDSNVSLFFTDSDYTSFIAPDTVCYGLNHSWFMYHHEKEMTTPLKEWKNSPLLIHKLIASVI